MYKELTIRKTNISGKYIELWFHEEVDIRTDVEIWDHESEDVVTGTDDRYIYCYHTRDLQDKIDEAKLNINVYNGVDLDGLKIKCDSNEIYEIIKTDKIPDFLRNNFIKNVMDYIKADKISIHDVTSQMLKYFEEMGYKLEECLKEETTNVYYICTNDYNETIHREIYDDGDQLFETSIPYDIKKGNIYLALNDWIYDSEDNKVCHVNSIMCENFFKRM